MVETRRAWWGARALCGALLLQAAALGQGEGSDCEAERAAWKVREQELLARIASLEEELSHWTERSQAREREWLAWVDLAEAAGVASLPRTPDFLGERPARQPAEEPSVDRRMQAALPDLRALLLAEGVRTLDFLELGALHEEGGRAWLGPVVARLLDEHGQLDGTLAADRLRLECSRTGWGVTLVFEQGYERHAGVQQPFDPAVAGEAERSGVRRVHLNGADPAPWIAAFPELLGSEAPGVVADDGLWDLLRVRQEVNRLLAADRRTGAWRLVGLGGVAGAVLQGVHVVELDEAGQIRRRLFADRMRILERADHVELELSDGVQERADRRARFLDDRYRIYLVGSSASAWREARLPGLGAPDRAGALPGPGEPPSGR